MLLLWACTPSTPKESGTLGVDLPSELTAPGPYPVGFREGSQSWAAPDGERSLRLVTWYPASDTAGTEPVYHRQDLSVSVGSDIPIAGGSFPVAVYSHGHMGYAEVSSFLAEHLASHGWIVLAPDHTGNTIADGSERSTEIYYERPLDISAVLDGLSSDTFLEGHVAEGPVLGLGHSFGGYTMLALAGARYDPAMMEACTPEGGSFCSRMTPERQALFGGGFREDRIGAFIAMAPGDFVLFGSAGLQEVVVPVLHMTATLDQPEGSEGDQIWEGLRDGDDRRMILLEGGHQSFSDFADQLEQVPLSALDGFRPIKAYTLAWGRWMRGDPAVEEFLEGEAPMKNVEIMR